MTTNQDCINARLVRYEYGSVADLGIPNNLSFPSTYYLSIVFSKGGKEYKSIFPVKICDETTSLFNTDYLAFINKVVVSVEKVDTRLIYHFSDGTNIWIRSD